MPCSEEDSYSDCVPSGANGGFMGPFQSGEDRAARPGGRCDAQPRRMASETIRGQQDPDGRPNAELSWRSQSVRARRTEVTFGTLRHEGFTLRRTCLAGGIL